MAFADELARVAVMQGAGDDQDDVVDHVAVRDVLAEAGERLS